MTYYKIQYRNKDTDSNIWHDFPNSDRYETTSDAYQALLRKLQARLITFENTFVDQMRIVQVAEMVVYETWNFPT